MLPATGSNSKAFDLALDFTECPSLDEVMAGLVESEIDTLFAQLFSSS